MDKTIQIDTFSRITQVSRETITSLKKYEDILIKANKTLNLVGNSTINDIWTRHFLDSAQVIDFIDKNDKTLVDLGSGAGFPGLVLAITLKDRKIPVKIKLIDKSRKKVKFLYKKANNSLIKRIQNLNLISVGNAIEYPLVALKFLEAIAKKINKFDGGLLTFDYGYTEKKNQNTLQSVTKHKYTNLFSMPHHSDITSHLNFKLFQ